MSLNESEYCPLITPYFTPTTEYTVELALYRVYGPIFPSGAMITDIEISEGIGDGVGNPSFREDF